jgi:triosephosphate isomerase (TIM)
MTATKTLQPLLALNWKLHKGPTEARAWADELVAALAAQPLRTGLDLAVMAPFISLSALQSAFAGTQLAYGAQDVSAWAKGAYTGEVSAAMLAELGCSYAVIGHSERRQYHFEADAVAGAKVKATQAAGIVPILCVGEQLPVREAGEAVPFTLNQLSVALEGVDIAHSEALVIAYEPIWAIGTGKTATPDDAEQMGRAIRDWLREKYGSAAEMVRLLYGGSVKPDNIAALLGREDVDGALVGGASLELASVLAMARALEA